ncbi:hypothetical protein FCU11_23865 [Vibrio diabolicus]|nr:hypothetical protein [Vibrio diabolicus]
MFSEKRNRAKERYLECYLKNLPSEALHQTALMTVDGIQPNSTDKSNPATLTYLGTTPPQ